MTVLTMSMPYLFIPIGILALFLYTCSYLMVRLELWQISIHRKLWNLLLLVTFILTATLGLLLVIKINFKLDWKFVEAFLKWHVDFGIAMSFVAIFHLSWHWRYYLNLLRRKENVPDKKVVSEPEVVYSGGQSVYLIILSGFIATVSQVLFMREIVTVFQGNELMMAWTLGIWMVLIGFGAYLGRKGKKPLTNFRYLSGIIVTTSILPVLLIPLLSVVKNILFPPGIFINPIIFLLLVILILFPICILSGLLFARLVHFFQKRKDDFIKVYGFESIGSMIGGIGVSFVMVQWFSIEESFLLMSIVTGSVLYLVQKRIIYILINAICLVSLILFLILPIDEWLKSTLFINQHIIETTESQLGNITVTENAGQYNFYENGNLLFTSENTIISEEYVHYALLQHKNPRQILLVSGGFLAC
jgi:spermidine synthase